VRAFENKVPDVVYRPLEPGSLLVFPLVDNAGAKRTILEIANCGEGDVWLQGFMVVRDGTKSSDPFVKKDFYVHLTPGEPFYWDTSKGYDREDPQGMRTQIQGFDECKGFCFVWAIRDPIGKLETLWNAVFGNGILIDGTRAHQYNAIPHQCIKVIPDRVLNLDGNEYTAGCSQLTAEGFAAGVVDGGTLALCSLCIDFVDSLQPRLDINADVWNQNEVAQSRHLEFYQFESYDLEADLQLRRDQVFTAKWTLTTTTTGPIWGVYLQGKGDLGMAANLWRHPAAVAPCRVLLPPVPLTKGP
jgi:hypothetical protein